jgi:2-oxoglutarate decarboxylase
VRSVPAKLLIDNRVVINNHLARSRGGKVSFTHLIGYALVKALKSMPEMNHAFAESTASPSSSPRPTSTSAWPSTWPSPTAPASCWSLDQVRRAMDFAGTSGRPTKTWSRRPATASSPSPTSQGTTISLTNPGTIGTVHSVPRLMQGQGAIIGVGAMEYPAEWQGASEPRPSTATPSARSSRSPRPTTTGSSRVPSPVTSCGSSTSCCSGRTDFYDEIFESLRIPYEPIRWVQDISASHDDDINKVARVQELIHAYRVRGHLMADTDPLEYRQRRHPDLEVSRTA